MAARPLLLLALLLPGVAAAQPVAPTPPARPHKPAQAGAPAPRAPVRRETAPVIHAKPGTATKRPPAHPAPPAPAPVVEPEKPPQPAKGSVTGLPLPRFVALRADEVYMRLGPGKRYPIEWVYRRRDLPVEVVREFEDWRLVRDQENTKGWVHQATLASRRTGIVTGGEHALRSDARDDSATVARLKPGVIVRLRNCDAASDWCQAQIQDYHGWMKRSEVWGILPGEAIP